MNTVISDILLLHPHWNGKIHSMAMFVWISPFILLKSLLTFCGIINNANLMPLVQYPPTIICMLIKKIPKYVFMQIFKFMANIKCFTPYWFGGSKNLYAPGKNLSLKFCLVMYDLLTGSFNISIVIQDTQRHMVWRY